MAKFKGVFIPTEILEKDLTPINKLVMGMIIGLSSKQICNASNKYLSDCIGASEKSITRSVKELEQSGLISIHYLPNYKRQIAINIQGVDNLSIVDNLGTVDKLGEGVDNLGMEAGTKSLGGMDKKSINIIVDNISNIIDSKEQPKKKPAVQPPSYTAYVEKMKKDAEGMNETEKAKIRPFFAALSAVYGEERLYDVMLKNLKQPPSIREIAQICHWANNNAYDVHKVLLKFSNYTRKRKEKFSRLYMTLINWKFTTTEVGNEKTATTATATNKPAYLDPSRRFS